MKNPFRKAVRSFDQVRMMVTRPLPIPGLEDTGKTIQFIAKKTEAGWWQIKSVHKVATVTSGTELVSKTLRAALEKHCGRDLTTLRGELLLNFDTAFMVLRDLEDSLLKYRSTVPGPEPEKHFLAAYRLMTEAMKADYDDRYFQRNRDTGLILAPQGPRLDPKKPDNGIKKAPGLN